jgi:acid stress-induced BolA-like protein IbaG/YrbA
MRGRWPLSDRFLVTYLMNANDVQALIAAGLPGAHVVVESDDNTHFASLIVAEQFAGKRMIQRHQLVYAALGAKMGHEIHALSIEALTPDEFAAQSATQTST